MSTINNGKSTWLITAKTNLHIGDESSTGYGLIDKSVQRDALMKLPCINSSSLKGSLNEFCCHNDIGLTADQIHRIFGSDKKENKRESTKGSTLFFDAGILFIPVQDDDELYKLAYCDEIIELFIEKSILFGNPVDKETLLEHVLSMVNVNKTKENIRTKENLFNEPCQKNDFIQLCSDDELPIIARNVLDNGESKNLWYEQVIPSETIFYTFMQSPGDVGEPEAVSEESQMIEEKQQNLENALNNKIVQVGANATIGYGYCKFVKI